MDLQTVITHLEDGTYQTIDEWKKDVNLIWKNAMSYHLEGSYIFSIAKELSDVFKKLCEGIPKSEIEMWTNKIRKTQAKLVKLINSKPGLIEKSASLNASKQRPTKILLRQKTN